MTIEHRRRGPDSWRVSLYIAKNRPHPLLCSYAGVFCSTRALPLFVMRCFSSFRQTLHACHRILFYPQMLVIYRSYKASWKATAPAVYLSFRRPFRLNAFANRCRSTRASACSLPFLSRVHSFPTSFFPPLPSPSTLLYAHARYPVSVLPENPSPPLSSPPLRFSLLVSRLSHRTQPSASPMPPQSSMHYTQHPSAGGYPQSTGYGGGAPQPSLSTSAYGASRSPSGYGGVAPQQSLSTSMYGAPRSASVYGGSRPLSSSYAPPQPGASYGGPQAPSAAGRYNPQAPASAYGGAPQAPSAAYGGSRVAAAPAPAPAGYGAAQPPASATTYGGSLGAAAGAPQRNPNAVYYGPAAGSGGAAPLPGGGGSGGDGGAGFSGGSYRGEPAAGGAGLVGNRPCSCCRCRRVFFWDDVLCWATYRHVCHTDTHTRIAVCHTDAHTHGNRGPASPDPLRPRPHQDERKRSSSPSFLVSMPAPIAPPSSCTPPPTTPVLAPHTPMATNSATRLTTTFLAIGSRGAVDTGHVAQVEYPDGGSACGAILDVWGSRSGAIFCQRGRTLPCAFDPIGPVCTAGDGPSTGSGVLERQQSLQQRRRQWSLR